MQRVVQLVDERNQIERRERNGAPFTATLYGAGGGVDGDLIEVERVGLADNFFQLGGHSVQATRLVARIRERIEVALSIRTVLEAATIGELAAAVENSRLPG